MTVDITLDLDVEIPLQSGPAPAWPTGRRAKAADKWREGEIAEQVEGIDPEQPLVS